MGEAAWIYLYIGSLVGAGMAVSLMAEKTEFPLPARLAAAALTWILVTAIWPLTLVVLILGKLRR